MLLLELKASFFIVYVTSWVFRIPEIFEDVQEGGIYRLDKCPSVFELHLFNRFITKVQWRMWCLLYLSRKNNLLNLFFGIRVKSHFPLICSRINFTVQISSWQTYIIDYRKKWNIVWKMLGICYEAFWKILYMDQN